MKYILQADENGSKPFHLLKAHSDGTYHKIGILWDKEIALELLNEANNPILVEVVPDQNDN